MTERLGKYIYHSIKTQRFVIISLKIRRWEGKQKMYKKEIGVAIWYLLKKGMTAPPSSPRKSTKIRVDSLGEDSSRYSTVKKGFADFKQSWESTKGDARLRRPKSVITDDQVEVIQLIVLNDKRVTVKRIAKPMGICVGSVHANSSLSLSYQLLFYLSYSSYPISFSQISPFSLHSFFLLFLFSSLFLSSSTLSRSTFFFLSPLSLSFFYSPFFISHPHLSYLSFSLLYFSLPPIHSSFSILSFIHFSFFFPFPHFLLPFTLLLLFFFRFPLSLSFNHIFLFYFFISLFNFFLFFLSFFLSFFSHFYFSFPPHTHTHTQSFNLHLQDMQGVFRCPECWH